MSNAINTLDFTGMTILCASIVTSSGSNQTVLGKGTASVAPLQFQAGTNLTTPVAGAIEYDGNVFYADVAASQRGVIPVESFYVVDSALTLVSQTGAQPYLAGTGGLTNGEITLPTGTYQFETQFSLSTLSASSGGFGFALGVANSAVIGVQAWVANAIKATIVTPANLLSSWNIAANTEIAAATTATVGYATIQGMFTLTTAGSIVPSLSQTTAAACVVGVGSYFNIWSIGSKTVASVGNWS